MNDKYAYLQCTNPLNFLAAAKGHELKVTPEVHDVDAHFLFLSVYSNSKLRLTNEIFDSKQIPNIGQGRRFHPECADE